MTPTGSTSAIRDDVPCLSFIIPNAIKGGIDKLVIDSLIEKMNSLFIPSDQVCSIVYCLWSCNPLFYQAAVEFYNMEGATVAQKTLYMLMKDTRLGKLFCNIALTLADLDGLTDNL
eukprot:GHVH01015703.1.p1 GENE.GHVH01015703.1~~GHVH01015703.1.p1  ORF type:complete len:116 (+),score=21.94 GHVH01015703.1:97-444(+)